MITRREILQVGAATAALAAGEGAFTRALAQQRLTEEDLLKFDPLGSVTLLHVADIHGQLTPVYFREPSGVLFEVATLGPGFGVDEDLDHLGEALILPPAFEHLREQIEPRLTPISNPRKTAEVSG